jgi:hypothetical protein
MHSDFKELFALFDKHRVRYLVVGGYAVMLYTEPRYTKDIDVVVGMAPEESDRAVDALEEFGFPMSPDQRLRFKAPNSMVVLGNPPHRIDILNSVSGLSFDEAFERRNVVTVDDGQIPFISLEDLISAKVAAGRPQDRLDLKKLRRLRK